MSILKSIAEILDDRDGRPDAELEVEKKVEVIDAPLAELAHLREEDRWAKAHEWRMRGIPIASIAKAFGVEVRTIYKWLKNYAEEYVSNLEKNSPIDLIGESLLFLSSIEEVCLYEATQADSGSTHIDGRTGAVVREKDPKSTSNKLKFISSALKARQMKIDLMLNTGVISREPERIYHKLEESRKTIEIGADAGKEKSREEVVQNILRLTSKGRSV